MRQRVVADQEVHQQILEETVRDLAKLYAEPNFRHFQVEEPSFFIADMTRYLFYCIQRYKQAEFNQFIGSLAKTDNDADYFRAYAYLFLLIFLKMGQYQSAWEFCIEKRLEERLEKVKDLINDSRLVVLYLNFLEINFYMQHWDQTLQLIQKMNASARKTIRTDIKFFIACIEILARAALGEFDDHNNGAVYMERLKRNKEFSAEIKKPVNRRVIRFLVNLTNKGINNFPVKDLLHFHRDILDEVKGVAALEHYHQILDWITFASQKGSSLCAIGQQRTESLMENLQQ